MKLEMQLANGDWVSVPENRIEEFLLRCETNNSLSRSEVLDALTEGRSLRNAPDDWYSNCRDREALGAYRVPALRMVRCDCGHMVPENAVMSASLGTSCLDCYDRMSA